MKLVFDFDNRSFEGQFYERPPLWMHLEDRGAQGYIRSCAPCPAVWVLKDDPHAQMTEQWQYYLRAINYNMTPENVYLLLDDHLAFANRTGFPSLGNPGGKADYFFRRNISPAMKFPNLDKVRTTSLSVMTGEEAGDYLDVKVFDSRERPPLKPGKTYPKRVEDADIDDYLYNPREHPWMFAVANIVNKRGEVVQFPRGALYPWFDNGKTIVSFIPHIANLAYGKVLYPLKRLKKIGANEPTPSPYRSQ